MTNLLAKIKAAIETHMINEEFEREHYHYGIRFESKARNVGDIIDDLSRHNLDREDEREFPEFGSDEYNAAMELDGVSAWDMDGDWEYSVKDCDDMDGHCYIIASDSISNEDDALDHNEIVMVDAKVIEVIF